MKKGKQEKKIDTAGFTLSEMLVALIILLFITSIVAEGIPVAKRAYTNVTDRANAELLSSTTLTLLRNELDLATDVITEDVTEDGETVAAVVAFQNGETGRWVSFENADGEDGDAGIEIVEYAGASFDTESTEVSRRLLVTKEAAAGLYASFDTITYHDGIFTIHGLKVQKDGDDGKLAGIDTFSVRAFNIGENRL